MTYAGGTHNRRKLDKKGDLIKKNCRCKSLFSRRLRLGVPGSSSTKRNQKVIKKVARPISNNRSAPRRSVLSTEHRKSSSLRKHQTAQCLIRGLVIPADMQEGDYLIKDPACEVNERGTRDKNDGNEVVDNCALPLDLELTERAEVDDETLPDAEEDWDCPEQTEIDKGTQLDFPFTMETRQSKKGRNKKKYNPYGEDFVIDGIVLKNLVESLVGLDEVAVPMEIDLVNDMNQD